MPRTLALALALGLTVLFGLFLGFYPLFLSGFKAIPGDSGDARLCHFILEWGYLWISGKTGPFSFWNPPIFYPTQNTLAYSDILLGSAPLYWLSRGLGMGLDVSFQSWMIGVSILNFCAFYFWMKKGLNSSFLAALAGAFLFAFGSPRLNFLGHSQLLPVFYTPLAALSIAEILKTRVSQVDSLTSSARSRRLWELTFFLSCIGQLYSGFYMGWFLGIGIAASLLISLAIPKYRTQLREKMIYIFSRDKLWLGALIVFSLLALFPMGYHYLSVAQDLGQRTIQSIQEPKLQSWIYLGEGSFLYQWQEKIRGFQVIANHEQRIGIGLVTLLLSFFGFYKDRKQGSAQLLAATFIVLFVCTTSFPPVGTLWKLLFPWIPAAGAIRALSRIGLALVFILATGFSLSLEHFRKKSLLLILVFCLLEQIRTVVTFNPDASNRRVEAIARQISTRCQSFIVGSRKSSQALGSTPIPIGVETSVDGMWAAIIRGSNFVPTLNGYSGNTPRDWKGDQLYPIPLDWMNSWLQRHHLDPNTHCIIEPQ